MNYYYATNTTKDSQGNRVDYIPLNSVESFSQIGDSMVVINMKAGNQFQIYKKFSTFEFREKLVEFEEIKYNRNYSIKKVKETMKKVVPTYHEVNVEVKNGKNI